jgi:DNA mismatch endonuclease (patch repair protein)
MRRMPRKDSKPELLLRRELHRRGLRYCLHANLPGRPDIVFTRARLAVFVDGCFWHRCPQHGVLPKSNGDWWAAKLERNVQRDGEQGDALLAQGWVVVRVWEHEEVGAAADRIVAAYRSQLPSASSR